jgi:hypothetical protein
MIIGLVVGNPQTSPFFDADPSTLRGDTASQNITIHEIPDSVDDRAIQEQQYSIRFQRTSSDTELFDRHLHDPVLVRGENNTTYLIASEAKQGNQVLYATNSSAPTDWTLIDDFYLGNQMAIDDIAYARDRYIAYANSAIYTATNLSHDNWTRAGDVPPGTNDVGAYYDGERVHIYYEADTQNGSSHSGKEIGHATSPDGIGNWTHYPTVFRAPGEYSVGDFEVIIQDDAVLLFGDYSRTHPKYEIRTWANDNFYTNFTMLEDPAIEPRSGNTTYTDDYAVQDGSVMKLQNGSYLLVANGHKSSSAEPRLHSYISTYDPSSPEADTSNSD